MGFFVPVASSCCVSDCDIKFFSFPFWCSMTRRELAGFIDNKKFGFFEGFIIPFSEKNLLKFESDKSHSTSQRENKNFGVNNTHTLNEET